MKTILKKPKNKNKCCDREKCCANIEWSFGYLIGETISCFVDLCLHFVNNANKGFQSRGKPNNTTRRQSL